VNALTKTKKIGLVSILILGVGATYAIRKLPQPQKALPPALEAQRVSWVGGRPRQESPEHNFSGSHSVASGPLHSFCADLEKMVHTLKWSINPCQGIDWKVGGKSVKGKPLIYADFGNPEAENTTLILATVHGDEITPLYIGLQLAHWIAEHQDEFQNTRVVIAPLVNPDGFLSTPRTRMNARGVDVNRNFATRDWHMRALSVWQKRYRSDPRRNPGPMPRSEPETVFQEELIKKIRPQKILSIHSPLNFLDYDGPSYLTLSRFPYDYVKECDRLRKRLRAISAGYFPGSLGNYAGQDLGIPTVTLELPSTDPKKANAYWKKFEQGIRTMIQFTVPQFASRNLVKEAGG
jgi:murein peptide amidase A